MSSEAAKKVFPDDELHTEEEVALKTLERQAFDRGAVEALRQAAEATRDAYPTDIFIPLSAERLLQAHNALKAIGLTLDGVSAHAMRVSAGLLDRMADEWVVGQ